MNRNIKAPLSPHEINSLRGLRADPARAVSPDHRRVLMSMGLVLVTDDKLNITVGGQERLSKEDKGAGAVPI